MWKMRKGKRNKLSSGIPPGWRRCKMQNERPSRLRRWLSRHSISGGTNLPGLWEFISHGQKIEMASTDKGRGNIS